MGFMGFLMIGGWFFVSGLRTKSLGMTYAGIICWLVGLFMR